MRTSFNNTLLPLLYLSTLLISLISCSSNDEAAPDPTMGLKKITSGYAPGAGARVEVWSKEDLVAGLNRVSLAIYDSVSNKRITDAHIHLNPVMDMKTMTHSCPVLNPEEDAIDGLFPGEILFTMASGDMGSWSLEVKVHNHLADKFGTASFAINVRPTTPSQVISFQAASGQRYCLSYLFPNGMKVGVNDFEVIAYTYGDDGFVPAEDLSIGFTPEMPAMDHGSPNNVNPVYTENGHYKGKANFTMTGDWRLNMQLQDGDTDLGSRYFDVVVN